MTIECSELEGEVILAALDHLVDHLTTDPTIALPLLGINELVIDVASDVARRVDGQLHPERVLTDDEIQASWLRFRQRLADCGIHFNPSIPTA